MRDEVKSFAQAMEYKLRRNDHKGGWEERDTATLFDRLEDEVRELRAAIEDGNPYEIVMEAADVANFAMMIAWNALKGSVKPWTNRK